MLLFGWVPSFWTRGRTLSYSINRYGFKWRSDRVAGRGDEGFSNREGNLFLGVPEFLLMLMQSTRLASMQR